MFTPQDVVKDDCTCIVVESNNSEVRKMVGHTLTEESVALARKTVYGRIHHRGSLSHAGDSEVIRTREGK